MPKSRWSSQKSFVVDLWRIGRPLVLGLGLLVLTACASTRQMNYLEVLGEPNDEFQKIDTLFGNYLAAQEATRDRNSLAAANYYSKALKKDPENASLLERAFLFEISAGNEERATNLAKRLVEARPSNSLAQLVLVLDEINRGRPERAQSRLGTTGRGLYNSLTVDLIKAWLLSRESNWQEVHDTLAGINALGSEPIFRTYHLALMHDLAGNVSEADLYYKKAIELSGNSAVRVANAYGRFLERTEESEAALALYRNFLENLPGHPLISQSLARAEAGEVIPDPLVADLREAAAEVLHGVAGLMAREQNVSLPLLYLQLALWENPKLIEAHLLMGELYWQGNQYERAARALAHVPIADPYSPSTAVQIALALERLDREDDAERVLRKAMADHPMDISATIALGDILRAHEKYEQAVNAYDRAFEIVGDEEAGWFLYYSRGAALELAGFWPEAERDLIASKERAPDQPVILNHLGYSWVDRGIRLQEGLELIQRAVDLSPGNGLIVDSLGWAYYRLGDYVRAVEILEQALELEPEDPEIHEHLGDAYWMRGREREARFQWQHAIDRGPRTPEQEARLRKKLVEGLQHPGPKSS